MKTIKILSLLSGFFLSGLVHADGVLTPGHGGRMVEVQGMRLELVTGADTIDLYVTGHDDKPVSVQGASAKVVLLANGKKEEVQLTGAGENRLTVAKGIAGGEKPAAVVTVQGLAKPISARFPAQP
ncbi:MAG: hypothetical protein HQL76_09050 [Magnetococcales bacterium]|nr:hypothetical protein [Magnetococcales bacterium]